MIMHGCTHMPVLDIYSEDELDDEVDEIHHSAAINRDFESGTCTSVRERMSHKCRLNNVHMLRFKTLDEEGLVRIDTQESPLFRGRIQDCEGQIVPNCTFLCTFRTYVHKRMHAYTAIAYIFTTQTVTTAVAKTQTGWIHWTTVGRLL